jgi:uncharacterized membrane protein YedE/YeeE
VQIVGFTPVRGLLGGVLIGAASAFALFEDGRVAGISGILSGLLEMKPGERAWRASFLGGLALAGTAAALTNPELAVYASDRPLWVVAIAGLLVGLGSRVAGGCTSGHGVCGVSRASPESIAATATFMIAGALVVFAFKGAFT